MSRIEEILERLRGGRTTEEVLNDALARMDEQFRTGKPAPHLETKVIHGMTTGEISSLVRQPLKPKVEKSGLFKNLAVSRDPLANSTEAK